jgi:hypothetical protein
MGDGLNRIGCIGYGTRQSNALQSRQVVQVIADKGHLVELEAVFGAQLIDR